MSAVSPKRRAGLVWIRQLRGTAEVKMVYVLREVEVGCDLAQPWRGCADDVSEARIIIHFAVHSSDPVELSMIECVECF